MFYDYLEGQFTAAKAGSGKMVRFTQWKAALKIAI